MRVLIVEDDMAIAGGLAPVISEAGCSLVGLAADRDTAVALILSTEIDLAMVDLHLLDGWTGLDVARAAEKNGVGVVFTTANPSLLPDDLSGAIGVIEKPYRSEAVRAALRHIAAERAGRQTGEAPHCLKLRTCHTRQARNQPTSRANAQG